MSGILDQFAHPAALPRGTTDAVVNRLFPQPSPGLADPVDWVSTRLGGHLWSKQREIIESVRDNRYTAVKSCHGAGKSWTAATVLAWWVDNHPPAETFVVWTAPRWPQVQAIIGRELRAMHKRAGLPGRITLDCNWYIGDALIGYGRKPADTDEHGFQGIHAKYVLVVVDEACGVPKQLWTAIESLMTNAHCRVLAIGNPDDPASEFAELFEPDSDYNQITISAYDTPNFTGEWIPPNLVELLVTEQWVEERKKRWRVDSMRYISKVLAKFPKVSHDTLFPPSLLLKAQNLDLPGFEKGRFGLDVARYGADATVLYRNRGGVIRKVRSWSKQSTMETADLVMEILAEHWSVPIAVDIIGLGAGVHDRFVQEQYESYPYNAGAGATDPDQFINARAESYWNMREDMEAGLIDLDPDDDLLLAELEQIKYKIVGKKVQIEDKDKIKKRLGRSPDHADAACISYAANAAAMKDYSEYIEAMTAQNGRAKSITHDLLTRGM